MSVITPREEPSNATLANITGSPESLLRMKPFTVACDQLSKGHINEIVSMSPARHLLSCMDANLPHSTQVIGQHFLDSVFQLLRTQFFTQSIHNQWE